ncbi:MAG TPA: hypothetical protein VH087_04195 [Thermoanaerobaculia bacterium]|nr:hypothetical protein [Thermoanaerobaculia bacterium]
MKVCDAVINGEIGPEYLQAIGFCLEASDKFVWNTDTPNGERVSEVASD